MVQESEREDRLSSLMRLAQEGDRRAYASLLREVTPMIRARVSGRITASLGQDRDDVVQEVLLSVHTFRHTYDPTRPFTPWLMGIVAHRLVDQARKTIRRAQIETTVDEMPETFAPAGTHIERDTIGDPEALSDAIALLPLGQRTAIEMMKLGEMSLKEASSRTGMSVAALKVAVHRAVKALRTALGDER